MINTMLSTAGIMPIIAVLLSQGHGDLVSVPEDRVDQIGESIQFLCSTDQNSSVNWKHIRFRSKSVEDIFISRFIVPPYHTRFKVNIDKRENNVTEYNLVISSVQREDAGTYRCHDKAGQGQYTEAQLTVLDSAPKCNSSIDIGGFIGENDCGMQPGTIHCSCTLGYTGNIAPEMKWITSNGQVLKSETQKVISDNSISSDLRVNASFTMEGSSIIWYSAKTPHHNWTSIPIKIQHVKANLSTVSIKHEDSFTCSANSNINCSYRWYARNVSTNEYEVQEGQNLTVSNEGFYHCEAICPLGHSNCIVTSLHVEYMREREHVAGVLLTAMCCILGCLLFVAVIAIIGLLKSRKFEKLKKEQKYEHVDPTNFSNTKSSGMDLI